MRPFFQAKARAVFTPETAISEPIEWLEIVADIELVAIELA